MDQIHLAFPLLSAFCYAASALFLKAGSREGVGPVRTTVIVLWVMAFGFAIFYPWREFPVTPSVWWPSLVVGIAFLLGHLFLVLAYARGDVSVATPVMGTKVLMVAVLVSLFSEKGLGWGTWLSAIITTVALILLVSPGKGMDGLPRKRVVAGFGYALATAATFAVFDVMIQEFSARDGFGLLAPFAMGLAAFGSLFLLRFARSRSFRFSPRAWKFLIPGIILLTIQAMLLIWTIGAFGDAAGANITYSSRAIWSVVLVWIFGSFFGDRESLQDRTIVVRRLLGAIFMVIGILLVFTT